MRMNRSALLALAAAFQVGCGGGGGDDGSSNPPPPPPPAGDTITSANGQEVSRGVMASVQFVKDLGLPDVAGGFVPTGIVIVTPASTAASPLATAIHGAVRRGVEAMRGIQTTSEDTVQCSLGGDITITANIADDSGQLTEGDAVSVLFNGCTEADGTLDGAVDLTVTTVTGALDNPPFSAGLDVNVDSVTLTQDTAVLSAGGTMTATIASESTNDRNLVLSGTELTTVVDDETMVLRDFNIDETDNLDTGAYTLDMSGTIDSDTLGTFDFATTTAFTGLGGAFPDTGVMVISGASATTATITALDNTNVRVDLDTDGDGTADESTDTTWDALTGED
jgi:hypothetical protein